MRTALFARNSPASPPLSELTTDVPSLAKKKIFSIGGKNLNRMVRKRREGGEAGAERARSSGSQLQLPSAHQVALAPWRVMMSFVRVLSNGLQKRLDTPAFVLILLKVVEVEIVFFFVFFCAAIASGLVTVILPTFSAPLPKRVVLSAFARRMRL